MIAAEYRARETVTALGLALVGLVGAAWLIVKSAREWTEALTWGAR